MRLDRRQPRNAAGINATLAQILAEWARVGETRIVNGERVAGSVTTLELSNVSETDALEIILRSVSAYLLVPRAVPQSGGSRFDRILILPTAAPPPRPVTAAAATPPPVIPRPQFAPPNRPEDDDPPPQNPSDTVPVPGRPPVFTTFPAAQPAQQVAPVPAGPTSRRACRSACPRPGWSLLCPFNPVSPLNRVSRFSLARFSRVRQTARLSSGRSVAFEKTRCPCSMK